MVIPILQMKKERARGLPKRYLARQSLSWDLQHSCSDLYLGLLLSLQMKPECDPGQWPACRFLRVGRKDVYCGLVRAYTQREYTSKVSHQNSKTLPVWLVNTCCSEAPQGLLTILCETPEILAANIESSRSPHNPVSKGLTRRVPGDLSTSWSPVYWSVPVSHGLINILNITPGNSGSRPWSAIVH